MSDILDRILAVKAREIDAAREARVLESVRADAAIYVADEAPTIPRVVKVGFETTSRQSRAARHAKLDVFVWFTRFTQGFARD